MKASQKMQPKPRQSGFTILEVMIAISILAIGLLAVFSGQNMAIQGNNRASHLTEGMTLAQDRMEELLALPYHDLDATGSPVYPPGGYKVEWTVTEYSADNYKLIGVQVTQVTGQVLKKSLELRCIKTLL
jgi:prepilin-type N-terminal cleavage/methylation domain-containing protein